MEICNQNPNLVCMEFADTSKKSTGIIGVPKRNLCIRHGLSTISFIIFLLMGILGIVVYIWSRTVSDLGGIIGFLILFYLLIIAVGISFFATLISFFIRYTSCHANPQSIIESRYLHVKYAASCSTSSIIRYKSKYMPSLWILYISTIVDAIIYIVIDLVHLNSSITNIIQIFTGILFLIMISIDIIFYFVSRSECRSNPKQFIQNFGGKEVDFHQKIRVFSLNQN